MLFEFDINKGKRKEMGIVLKRRDNAPVVKDVYGGVIDILMKEKSVEKAIEFTEKQLQALVDGDIPIEKLIITKSLRSNYKNPKQIAHKVLADRIGIRDPGNKPRSGDRIPYAYIVNPDKKALQGDRIETPTFIKDNDLQLDYAHYITNQIMKPLLQVFALVLEQIPGYNKVRLQKNIDKYTEKLADKPDKLEAKIEQLKEKEAQAIIFDKYIKMVK
jgi:DNA polymerase elongation subunit (family B)